MINMANFNSRIQQKSDTYANWAAQNPVLLAGEIIIVTECSTDSGPSVRLKVGDGTTAFNDLAFLDADVVEAMLNIIGILDEHGTNITELQESKVEIDNQTIIKGEDGKIKAVPDPVLEKAKATDGIGWQESSTIVYTPDMYDAAEKLYITDEDTGEQEVFLVKISDEVVTRDELLSLCSLTISAEIDGELESMTFDRDDPDYADYFGEEMYFGDTGVMILVGYAFSCSQEELLEEITIPAGTWLPASIALSYSSVVIKHGLRHKISEEYIPSNVVVARLQDWEDDESFNTYIREPFSKGKTVIAKYYSSDYCLVLSVDQEASSFTATKNDGLIYKYTLADGNWTTNEEIYVQSSKVMADEEELTASTSSGKIPLASTVYNLINARTLPTGQRQGDMVIWDYTNSRWILAHAQGGCGYSYYTATETITEKIEDRFLPDSVVVKRFTESHIYPSHLAEALEAGNAVYWSIDDAGKEGGRIIGWEIVGDVSTIDCQFILTFDRSPTAKKIYTPDDAYKLLSLTRYTVTALPSELYLSTNYSSSDNKTYKITASGGSIILYEGSNYYRIDPSRPATTDYLGSIRVGSNLSITEDGTLSAVATGSYEDLSDKPFYDTRVYSEQVITWDGNTDGRVADSMGISYKVSDLVPDIEDFVGATITTTSGTVTVDDPGNNWYGYVSDDGKCFRLNSAEVVVIKEDNWTGNVPGMWSATFPEAGIYFQADTRSLTMPPSVMTTTGQINITWDGDTTDKVTDATGVAYKVSDTVFDLADCDKLTYTDSSGNTTIFTPTATSEAYTLSYLREHCVTSDGKLWGVFDWGPIIVMEDNYSGGVPGGLTSTFPEKGVYFSAANRSLTATISAPVGELKQIDSKYIPEDYINSLIDAKLGVIESGSY